MKRKLTAANINHLRNGDCGYLGLMEKGDKKVSETVKDPATSKKKTVKHGARGYSIASAYSTENYCYANFLRTNEEVPKGS